MPAMYIAHGKMAAWLGSLLKVTSLQASTAGPKSKFRALTISRGASREPGEELDQGKRRRTRGSCLLLGCMPTAENGPAAEAAWTRANTVRFTSQELGHVYRVQG